tara:strand:+ start:379 stop:540 length:162 start_codon:yes stop_codon:yes gene_type:complete
MTDHAKTIFDVSSLTIVAGTLMEYLPAFAALASIVWSCIRIYETKTVQGWIKK